MKNVIFSPRQTCVMRGDFGAADQILPTIPKEQRNRVAHFLQKQGIGSHGNNSRKSWQHLASPFAHLLLIT